MVHWASCARRLAFLAAGLTLGVGAWAQASRDIVVKPSAAANGAVTPSTPADAIAVATADDPWSASFEAFAEADRLKAPPSGGIVFVGSSSIRLWEGLESQFDGGLAIVKRGFGGSRMSDCSRHVDRLVLPYKPRLVVVYAGDNDLAEGRTPDEVLASFRAFVERVRLKLPATRIAYLSIKPSPLREALLPRVNETNRLIAAYSRSQPNLDYIDVYSRMLGPDGRPRAELFSADNLHLNQAGYALWKTVIASHLPE
jgi:lysophospholipase L1-like esterase